MSILIPGKMPTKSKLPTESTFEAWFYPSGVVAFYDSNGNSLGASKWKELPPHGRVIDADAFLARNAYFAEREFVNPKYDDTLKDLIDRADTIIPADGGADNG